MLPQTFARYHDWDRGFCDQIVGEGTKDDTAFDVSSDVTSFKRRNEHAYPLSALLPLLPKITNVGEM